MTRPNPPAMSGGRRTVAIVYLIPNLGDCVMVFPLLDALRRENPEVEISCFTYAGGQILACHPAIDRHYNLSRDAVDRLHQWRGLKQIAAIWVWWSKTFRGLSFERCILLRGGIDPFASPHLAWLLGGARRIGFSATVEPEISEHDLGQDALLTERINELQDVHEIQRGWRVLQRAGLVRDPIDIRETVYSLKRMADGATRERLVRSFPALSRPYVIVAPGGSAPYRRWPRDRFAEVAEKAFATQGLVTVLVGGPDEVNLCTSVAERISGTTVNMAGLTDFLELVTLCNDAHGFLGNDSGPAHVAGACGTPTVIVSAYARSGERSNHSSPWRSHPAGPFVEVVQPLRPKPPCIDQCMEEHTHCIEQVGTQEVVQVVERLLAAARATVPDFRTAE